MKFFGSRLVAVLAVVALVAVSLMASASASRRDVRDTDVICKAETATGSKSFIIIGEDVSGCGSFKHGVTFTNEGTCGGRMENCTNVVRNGADIITWLDVQRAPTVDNSSDAKDAYGSECVFKVEGVDNILVGNSCRFDAWW